MARLSRRAAIGVLMAGGAALGLGAGRAHAAAPAADQVLHNWYRMILELVRHTPTQSPPVASRAFAYVGITAFEAVASGNAALVSLAGQVNGLTALPRREPGAVYDEAVLLNAALSLSIGVFFANTGPSGRQAVARMDSRQGAAVLADVAPDVAARSVAQGRAVAQLVLDWSQSDGGAVIENMGFPHEYALTPGPEHWVPTSLVAQQQLPLLPGWGEVRTFAMPSGATCGLPPPPAYSEEPGSAFHTEAMEVHDAVLGLTPDQRAIARFWSDDPMLSPTPPGHWISIAMQIMERDALPVDRRAETLARLGIALADAFIGCWHAKFEYDLVRPLTYIRRVIDPKWEALLNTPPFPEYPSGHSTQSAAAAEVLTLMFGEGFAFEDATHAADGLKSRSYPDFRAAAEEAGLSRLYGGIHFRAAIERGLEQGRCIGAYANALKTRVS